MLFDFSPQLKPKDFLKYAHSPYLKKLVNTYKPEYHQDV